MGPWLGLTSAIWAALWIGIVLVMQQERLKLYDLLDRAMREGRDIPPEILSRLGLRPVTSRSNLRPAVILIAVSLGLFSAGLLNFYTYTGPHRQLFFGPFGLFPIPLFIGLAYLLLAWLRKDGRETL